MPAVIERGHLYIAQPPLYKVKRGQSEQYLKDERAREEFLVSEGLKDAVLTLASGEQRVGADLRALVELTRQVRASLEQLAHKYPRFIVEQVAIAGALSPEALADRQKTEEALAYVARRLDLLAPELERGWRGEIMAGRSLRFSRELRGVLEVYDIDDALITSQEARRLNRLSRDLGTVFGKLAKWRRGQDEREVRSPTQLLDIVLEAGGKGLSFQRYKGLGEMNADQLWETTMNPETRVLLRAEIEDAALADSIFTMLMGEKVGPRKDFIKSEARKVRNLDI
jgi:DNA gyrase subunit B